MTKLTADKLLIQLKNIVSIYATDSIFVVGKGPSIDQIDPQCFEGSLVIGINDAERIINTDITILRETWAEQSLAQHGFKSQLYIAPDYFHGDKATVLKAPYVPLTQLSAETLMQRFMQDELVIEDVMFLTALQVARKVADIRNRKMTVYMVGFDFDPKLGHSVQLGHDFSPIEGQHNELRISTQEFYFLNTLYFLKDSQIDVRHVGNKSFSALTAVELNASLNKDKEYDVYAGKVNIVAELTTNHFGDRTRLERMIRSAKAAGANSIKVQKRDVNSFYSREQLTSHYVSPFGTTFADYRHQLELNADDFEFISNLCKELQVDWFASVLDRPSFEFVQQFNPAMIKLPSTISEHQDYLKYVANNYTGAVVLSTGMTDSTYEQFILNYFSKAAKIYLLQCNSAYPTPLHDCNIAVVRHYHELSLKHPRIVPGYSSHDIGWMASSLAVAAGARMLEKHVKLGTTEWAHFDAVAIDLTTTDFKDFVDHIRQTEVIIGTNIKQINDSEHHKYQVVNSH